MATATSTRSPSDRGVELRWAAAGLCLAIAAIYGLIWSGAVSVVVDAEPGELGILGFAGAVFLVLAGLLWRFANRALWAAVTALQLLVIWMYIAVGAEREPAFELWGISIRVLQVALIGVLVTLLVGAWRGRGADR
jgi:hypothetical protein